MMTGFGQNITWLIVSAIVAVAVLPNLASCARKAPGGKDDLKSIASAINRIEKGVSETKRLLSSQQKQLQERLSPFNTTAMATYSAILAAKLDALMEREKANARNIEGIIQIISKLTATQGLPPPEAVSTTVIPAASTTLAPTGAPPSPTPLTDCGGTVMLAGTQEFAYKLPETSQEPVVCAWVIWAKNGGPIRLTRIDSPEFQFDPNFVLQVQYNHTIDNLAYKQVTDNNEKSFDSKFIFVFFSGKPTGPNQGVHFVMTDAGTTESPIKPFMLIAQDSFERTMSMKYPTPPAKQYRPNDRLFVLFKAIQGKRLGLQIINVDTEECCDWLEVDYFDPDSNLLQTARMRGKTPFSYTFKPNIPIIFSFSSNEQNQGSGFVLNYLYGPA